MDKQTRLIITGGFLGAGKTTLIWDVAQRLMAKGLRVGLITNDQAPELVDSRLLKQANLQVEEVAGSCFYTLRRQGKVIEGPSVRMAEIIASSWGNLRVQARIISNDGKMITAQGICHDLESNYATSTEVKRRITDKNGKTFSEDMQVVTGNAACAIAMRNALFKVVPAALVKKVIDKAKKVSLGESMTLETSRAKMLQYFSTIGVDERQIFEYLSVDKVDEIDIDMVVELRGLATAIKEGTTSIKEAFAPKFDEEKAKEVAEKFKDFMVEEGKEDGK